MKSPMPGHGGLWRVAGAELDRDAGVLGGARKDLKQFKATLEYLRQRADQPGSGQTGWTEYARYYEAQALFQGDVAAWEKWNRMLVRQLKQAQTADGSFRGQQVRRLERRFRCWRWRSIFGFLPIYER